MSIVIVVGVRGRLVLVVVILAGGTVSGGLSMAGSNPLQYSTYLSYSICTKLDCCEDGLVRLYPVHDRIADRSEWLVLAVGVLRNGGMVLAIVVITARGGHRQWWLSTGCTMVLPDGCHRRCRVRNFELSFTVIT